jgi:hypothetical protein
MFTQSFDHAEPQERPQRAAARDRQQLRAIDPGIGGAIGLARQ